MKNDAQRQLLGALVSWKDLKYNSRALFIGSYFPETEVIYEVLKEKVKEVDKATLSDIGVLSYSEGEIKRFDEINTLYAAELTEVQKETNKEVKKGIRIALEEKCANSFGEKISPEEKYDYIIGVGIIEASDNPADLIMSIRRHLTNEGVFLVGCDNRLAMRYFCGDKDLFSKKVFDGIDNYADTRWIDMAKAGGRSYSMAEIKSFFTGGGFNNVEYYSVMPSIFRPQIMLKEGYKPNENLDVEDPTAPTDYIFIGWDESMDKDGNLL